MSTKPDQSNGKKQAKTKTGKEPAGSSELPKIKMSAAVAFIRLITAVKKGHTVLVLTPSDACTSHAVQEYNDYLQNLPSNDLTKEMLAYASLSDTIAGNFEQQTAEEDVKVPRMPPKDVIRQAGAMLRSAFKSGLTEGWSD
jgi:hypothetical protein